MRSSTLPIALWPAAAASMGLSIARGGPTLMAELRDALRAAARRAPPSSPAPACCRRAGSSMPSARSGSGGQADEARLLGVCLSLRRSTWQRSSGLPSTCRSRPSAAGSTATRSTRPRTWRSRGGRRLARRTTRTAASDDRLRPARRRGHGGVRGALEGSRPGRAPDATGERANRGSAPMSHADRFDFVIIGAGAAGEAALELARARAWPARRRRRARPLRRCLRVLGLHALEGAPPRRRRPRTLAATSPGPGPPTSATG